MERENKNPEKSTAASNRKHTGNCQSFVIGSALPASPGEEL